ncbi:acyl-CoA/acyl-ACP dehydrogenase [Paenibacillus sp. HWE-109]|uniref:acyl-CoA dehydrogenase family protein n=1 Tax=Paenibacillus sp. HWE-109 TaxID=1306526 RepID=UPI001EDE63CB|nr:acyl-CoA dehydrogenase family protein [Paenibacillus sp. HWE-109]UKS27067.1 acyl-CoA/acyl-ACP dehydrogenase [Paenibacillus sp. HWE-109]
MTTDVRSDAFIRNEREAELAQRSDRLAARFAERSALHDTEGSFPFANFADLREAGYLQLTVPRAYGGEEASLYELVLAQERLARGDGSTALAVGWHVGLLHQLRFTHAWPETLYARFCRESVETGALVNHLATERATGSPSRGGRPETKAVATKGGWLLSGRKTYSTLSPILTCFTVSAAIEGTEETGEFYVRAGSGVRVEETWNTLGMRATGSHDVVLEDVFVPDDQLVHRSGAPREERTPDEGGWLLHIPACYIGIAHAARSFAINFAQQYRPNSLTTPIAELPNIRRQIGEMEIALVTARTVLYSVADRWDREPERRKALKAELGLAKQVATNQAISIVDTAMRVVGAASLSRSLPLERMYRDVRAGLHNPPMDDIVVNGLAQRALDEVKLMNT